MIIPLLDVLNQSTDSYFLNLEFIKKYLPSDPRELLINVLMIIVLIYVFKNLILFFFYFWRNKFIWNIYKFISITILNGYLNKDIDFFFKKKSNDLINTTILESRSYIICFNEYLKIISEIFLLTAITVFLLTFDFQTTIYVVLLISISSLVILKIYKKKLSSLGKVRLEASVSQLKSIQQIFFSLRDIKIKSAENFFSNKYLSSIFNYSKTSYLSNSILEVPKIFFELVFIFSITLMVFILISGSGVDNKDIITSVGIYSVAAFRMFPSVTKVVHAFQQINFLKPSIEKVLPNLITRNLNNKKNNNSFKKISFNKKIIFKNVIYKYPGEKNPVINNLTFEVNKGDFVGIIGKSGTGKSTILDLLMGLIEPESGQIKSDNTDISLNLKEWKRNLGYVSQNTIMLDDSIKNNIAFGVPEDLIDEDRLIKAAKNAQIFDFVSSLKNQFQTKVGERGVALSGGQIQRIGIARELYRKPTLILLDEATSALDNETEKDFLNCLKNLNKDMTILFVSHRKTALSECNKIINLTEESL